MIVIKKLKVCSLFSGIGGFEIGIQNVTGKENMEIVFASEIDKYASTSYEMYFDHKPHGDITKINTYEIPEHDILTAGFPCQPFSISGQRKGFNDTRGTLFFEIERVLEDKQPKVFILENVKGLLSHNKPKDGEWKKKGYPSLINPVYDGKKKGIGYTLQAIEETLLELNYNVFWNVLNTKDYGLPQNRERIYFIGFRKDLGIAKFDFSKPIVSKLRLEHILDQDGKLPILHNIYGGFKEKKPRVFYDNSPTIRTAKGGGHIPSVCTNDNTKIEKEIQRYKIRKLTSKECWRLQGFSDEYHDLVSTEISTTQRYKQAGNAVSTNVVSELFKQILATLHSENITL